MRRFIRGKCEKIIEELIDVLKSDQMQILLCNTEAEEETQEHINILLEELQKKAICVGEILEKEITENKCENKVKTEKELIGFLERYCELLYQISVQNHQKSKVDLVWQAESTLEQILCKIRTEISADKAEVFFLPYKASMWDSFESVWIAAKQDETCNVHVVPIPYYDKMPDGKFGKMHYEGALFQDNVKVENWEKMDLKKIHPEVIFIHNPYDNMNRVTSVYPDFYAKVLRNLTEKLVYIPYFVVINDVSAEFCVCPGTLYAHQVIVQSEIVRKTYIKEYRSFVRAHHLEEVLGNAEEKFLALGSPKFDKVLNTVRGESTMPESWKKLIWKENGERRKVILYNTTLHAFLENSEKMLIKMAEVISFFTKDKSKEVILWWRPHPLLEETIASMRPELLEIYQKLVREYRSGEYGIYDDTPDLHRAIAETDAYYGDWSSLVSLYEVTGKPIMIQNTSELGTEGDTQ